MYIHTTDFGMLLRNFDLGNFALWAETQHRSIYLARRQEKDPFIYALEDGGADSVAGYKGTHHCGRRSVGTVGTDRIVLCVKDSSRKPVGDSTSAQDFDIDVGKASRNPQAEPSHVVETKEKPDLVEFDGPWRCWNPKEPVQEKRMGVTVAVGLGTFVVTFATSNFCVTIGVVSVECHIIRRWMEGENRCLN
jgi:hypothetical protein